MKYNALHAASPLPILFTLLLLCAMIHAAPEGKFTDNYPNAPLMNVNQTEFGKVKTNDRDQLVEKIRVSLLDVNPVSAGKASSNYKVQCFFFKHENASAPLSLHDGVAFDAKGSDLKYEIEVKNIVLPPPPKKPKATKSNPHPKAPLVDEQKLPKFSGCCVVVMKDGKIVNRYYSDDDVRQAVHKSPSILNPSSLRSTTINPSTGL